MHSHAPPRATGKSGDHQRLFTRRHAPTQNTHALSRARRAKCWHVPSAHDVMDDVILHYPVWLGWPGLTRTDLETWPGPNRLKKKKKKMLWPSKPLTLTKKSKFSKRTCPTQFFEYIPILEPISSFEAQKLCKCLVSKSWRLHKYWPKSQNFQEVPILPNFSCRFHFWGLFLHLRIWNCSIVWFYNCWF